MRGPLSAQSRYLTAHARPVEGAVAGDGEGLGVPLPHTCRFRFFFTVKHSAGCH